MSIETKKETPKNSVIVFNATFIAITILLLLFSYPLITWAVECVNLLNENLRN